MTNKISITVDLTAAAVAPSTRAHSMQVMQDKLFKLPASTQYNKVDDLKGLTIPQVYYMENVLPTAYGFSSVAFVQAVPEISSTADLRWYYTVKDASSQTVGYAYVVDETTPANSGDYFLLNAAPYVWEKDSNGYVDLSAQENPLVSKAFVVGRQFLYYSNEELREYTAGALADVAFIGLNPAAIRGICGVSNYLIAFDESTVYWSSLENPLDFTPSILTGAGSIIPNGLGGTILSCHPIKDGFMIYTTGNVVSAHITNDFYSPFIFAEVPGSSGLSAPQVTVHNNNNPSHMVISSAGIQKLDKQEAKLVYPAISDLLADKIIETYNPATDEVEEDVVSDESFGVAIANVTSRFTIISYGRQSVGLTEAWIHDASLDKYGRLKVEHDFCDLWPFPVGYTAATWEGMGERLWEDMVEDSWDSILGEPLANDVIGRQLIAFIKKTGEISLVHMGINNNARAGVIMFGYYQPTRLHHMMLTDVSLNNAAGSVTVPQAAVKIHTSYDGLETDVVTSPTLIKASPRTKYYKTRVTGLRHSLAVAGAFDLSSVHLTGVVTKGRFASV